MTTDEIRDELARLKGWKSRPYAGILKLWYHPDGRERMDEHPMPPTLDGANAAMNATGYAWERTPFEWWGWKPGSRVDGPIKVDDTGMGNEIHDLYALALACVRAEEKTR